MVGQRLRASVLVGAAALALCVFAAPRRAGAIEVLIGGRAQICSEQAKAGIANPVSLENCSMAILAEMLSGRSLAATYLNRGVMFLDMGNYGSAMHDFDQALDIEPRMGEAMVNRGAALIGMKRYQEALDELNRGLQLDPEEPEKAYGNRALAKWSLDDIRGAYNDFMKAHELKPDWTWPTEQLAHFRVETRAAR
jgi:tetratricopeptide (TPR) repeat protein